MLKFPIGGGNVVYINAHHISAVECVCDGHEDDAHCRVFLISGEHLDLRVAASEVVAQATKAKADG